VYMDPSRSTHSRPQVRPELRTGVTRNVICSLLAATLMATIAIPSFAETPRHGQHDGRHAQQLAQDVRAAGKRSGKRRTVSKSFANGQAVAIPTKDAAELFGSAEPYPSSIGVSGFKQGKITDLNLTLRGFSHTFAQDVDVMLVAPDGRNAVVMGDVGGIGAEADAQELTITLDDEAVAELPVGVEEALKSGSFRTLDKFGLADTDEPDLLDFPAPAPTPSGNNALSTFDGSNPNGEWRLFVLDDTHNDEGSLDDGWTLKITATTKKAKKRKH
jgi:subtilisin-like proprotein convertase family protein